MKWLLYTYVVTMISNRLDGFGYLKDNRFHGHRNDCLGIIDTGRYARKYVFRDKDTDNAHYESLVNEYKILKSCDHKNIIKVFDFYDIDNVSYFDMELGEKVSNFNKNIFNCIVNAVEYLFNNSIVHQDLNKNNIVVVRGEPKLIDFQVAKIEKQEVEFKKSLDSIGKRQVNSCCGPFINKNLIDLSFEMGVPYEL